jgi:hypothetical protein
LGALLAALSVLTRSSAAADPAGVPFIVGVGASRSSERRPPPAAASTLAPPPPPPLSGGATIVSERPAGKPGYASGAHCTGGGGSTAMAAFRVRSLTTIIASLCVRGRGKELKRY